MIQEQGVGGQLLLLLNPENQGKTISKAANRYDWTLVNQPLPFGEEERLSWTRTSRHQQRRSGRRRSNHVIQPIYVLSEGNKKDGKLWGWKTTPQTGSELTLPSESLTGRWCCCRPAGRTPFVPARRARPKGHLQSLLHIHPLTPSPWSQCLRFQGRVTPTWWRSNL